MSRELYQDQWVDGIVVESGVRDCASRWPMVRATLDRFERPFSVLDLGANFGYFGFRIVAEYPQALVVMIESPRGRRLAELAELQRARDRLIVLDRRILPAELVELAACEHFDVVLALNFFHHLGGGRKQAFRAVRRMGWRTLVETPDPADEGACGRRSLRPIFETARAHGKLVARFDRHTGDTPSHLFELPAAGSMRLSKPYYRAPAATKRTFRGGMEISCDYRAKVAHHGFKGETIDWVPAINLRTYAELGGIWPRREALAAKLRAGELEVKHPHGDLQMWNILLAASRMVAIDRKPHLGHRDEGALERIAQELEG
jgi:hypothetical protein